jgi:aminoglycoside 6-adenylyltransferase
VGLNVYSQLLKKFTIWAQSQEDIRAAIMVGSRARSDHPADAWSDLDLMIYSNQPEQYLTRMDWMSRIGEVWIALASHTAGNEPEYLVTFAGGYNVDFVFNPFAELEDAVRDGIIPYGHWRGARVIVDKTGLAVKTIPPNFKAPTQPLPNSAEFLWVVNAFFYTAFYMAKMLRRGDLVMVKQRDADLKRALIQMIEWHARGANARIDTWHMGRNMQEWADPFAWKALQKTYAHFDADDSWQALLDTLELFRLLSLETASRLDFSYPIKIEQNTTQLIMRLYTGKSLEE